jgi:hypothetical protein
MTIRPLLVDDHPIATIVAKANGTATGTVSW